MKGILFCFKYTSQWKINASVQKSPITLKVESIKIIEEKTDSMLKEFDVIYPRVFSLSSKDMNLLKILWRQFLRVFLVIHQSYLLFIRFVFVFVLKIQFSNRLPNQCSWSHADGNFVNTKNLIIPLSMVSKQIAIKMLIFYIISFFLEKKMYFQFLNKLLKGIFWIILCNNFRRIVFLKKL